MPSSRLAARVSALLAALAVAGCSVVAIGYRSAPTFVYWRLDQALDFDSTQGADVRGRLDRLHAWHRVNELEEYARFLGEVRRRIGGAAGTGDVTWLHDEIRRRYERILDAAAPDAADVVLALRGEQLEALERRFARMREDFTRSRIDVGPERAREDMYRHALKALERWYGEFDAPARERLRRVAAEIPSDTRLELEDLRRRQDELLAFLRSVLARQVTDRAEIAERLKRLFGRWEERRTPAYADYAEKNRLALHRFYAEGANIATPEQRSRAGREVQHYIDEIAALVPQRAASR